MWQGYDVDESDDEWDGHIQRYYGAQTTQRLAQPVQRYMDPGMGMTDILIDTLTTRDRIRDELASERNNEHGPGNSRLATLGREGGPIDRTKHVGDDERPDVEENLEPVATTHSSISGSR